MKRIRPGDVVYCESDNYCYGIGLVCEEMTDSSATIPVFRVLINSEITRFCGYELTPLETAQDSHEK